MLFWVLVAALGDLLCGTWDLCCGMWDVLVAACMQGLVP